MSSNQLTEYTASLMAEKDDLIWTVEAHLPGQEGGNPAYHRLNAKATWDGTRVTLGPVDVSDPDHP